MSRIHYDPRAQARRELAAWRRLAQPRKGWLSNILSWFGG